MWCDGQGRGGVVALRRGDKDESKRVGKSELPSHIQLILDVVLLSSDIQNVQGVYTTQATMAFEGEPGLVDIHKSDYVSASVA